MIETKPLFTKYGEAELYLKEKFGVNESYDVGILHTHLYEFPVLLVYINGLIDGMVTYSITDEYAMKICKMKTMMKMKL